MVQQTIGYRLLRFKYGEQLLNPELTLADEGNLKLTANTPFLIKTVRTYVANQENNSALFDPTRYDTTNPLIFKFNGNISEDLQTSALKNLNSKLTDEYNRDFHYVNMIIDDAHSVAGQIFGFSYMFFEGIYLIGTVKKVLTRVGCGEYLCDSITLNVPNSKNQSIKIFVSNVKLYTIPFMVGNNNYGLRVAQAFSGTCQDYYANYMSNNQKKLHYH